MANKNNKNFSNWINKFLETCFRLNPVNATFVGNHDYDHLLPDFSRNGLDQAVNQIELQLKELKNISINDLDEFEKIDFQLAENYLNIQLCEFQSRHFYFGNPSLYTGEAIFSLLSLFLTDFASIESRIQSASERMHQIPNLLTSAKRNIDKAPLHWIDRAIRECRGASLFLTKGIEQIKIPDGLKDLFSLNAETARKAFEEFEIWLEMELKPNANNDYACGEGLLSMYLRDGHCISESLDSILVQAEENIKIAAEQLSQYDLDEVHTRLKKKHTTVENYYDHYQTLWDEVKSHCIEHDLVTFPEFPIRYIPRPKWARDAFPYLYFLFYRSPAAFCRPEIHDYLVTPIEKSFSSKDQEKLLEANNESVMKLNHVIHHGSIGHHVQNWNAFRSKSKIGQVAAVDCASRIFMFCGGTMAEGWACYATDLMNETGFLTEDEKISEIQSRIRMCARAAADIKLHTGEFTLEETAAFYQERALMPEQAALGEAVKNSMFPGAALMYMIGRDKIHELREKMKSALGDQFSLKKFHDEFLSYGSIPVALICSEMERKYL